MKHRSAPGRSSLPQSEALQARRPTLPSAARWCRCPRCWPSRWTRPRPLDEAQEHSKTAYRNMMAACKKLRHLLRRWAAVPHTLPSHTLSLSPHLPVVHLLHLRGIAHLAHPARCSSSRTKGKREEKETGTMRVLSTFSRWGCPP